MKRRRKNDSKILKRIKLTKEKKTLILNETQFTSNPKSRQYLFGTAFEWTHFSLYVIHGGRKMAASLPPPLKRTTWPWRARASETRALEFRETSLKR